MSTCRPAILVSTSGTPTPSRSRSRSWSRYSIVLAANASNWTESPSRASAIALATVPASCRTPLATASPPRYTVSASIRTTSPSRSRSNSTSPRSSISGMPACTSTSGPRLGYRPEIDGLALSTAATPTATSESAATRSRSTWSMTAMSPGRSRPTRRLVRRSSRTVPVTTPGSALRDRRKTGRRIVTHPDTAGLAGWTRHAYPAGPPLSGLLLCRHGEQLLRVRDAQIRVGQAGEHPGQLPRSLGVLHHTYPARGDRAAGVLGDDQVPVGECRHLGQMRHHQYLMGASQPGQPAPDLHRRLSADTRVHLVEDQRGRATGTGEHHLDREHHPGQLTARGALLQRQRRCPRVRRQLELDVVGAVGTHPALGARDRQYRLAPAGRARGDHHLDPGVRHGQSGQLRGDRLGEPAAGLPARGPDPPAQLGHLPGQPDPLPVQLLQQLVG